MVEAWVQNLYNQLFCGMEHFQWQFPCNSSNLVHFRKRIRETGVEKLQGLFASWQTGLEPEVVDTIVVQEETSYFLLTQNSGGRSVEGVGSWRRKKEFDFGAVINGN